MTHGVGADVLCDARKTGIFTDHSLNTAGGQAAVIAAGVGFNVFAVANKEGSKGILACSEVLFNPIGGRFANVDWAVFLSLTAYHELTTLGVDVVPVEVYQFGHTKATRE